MANVCLTVRVHFSALHSLENKSLTEAENREIFGKCYRTHGHDYYLEVTIEGAVDPKSGLIADRDFFYDSLDRHIVKPFNGAHLNEIFKNTAGEALALEFEKILREKLKPLKFRSLRLQETPKNSFSTDFRF